MTNPLSKLAALRGSLGDATHVTTKADVDAWSQQRNDYRLFIEDRTAEGWTQADIDEFAALVKEAMQTKDGADASADFLADQARIIRDMRAALHERFLLAGKRLSQPLPPGQAIFCLDSCNSAHRCVIIAT